MTTLEDDETDSPYPEVVSGAHVVIRMTAAVKAEFDNLSLEVREFILATMSTYAGQRQPRPVVPKGRFNADEGRFAVGHHLPDMQIGAFKHPKAGVRIYGSCFHFVGRATFLCSEIDVNKKSQKADQNKLKSSAKKLGNIIHVQDQKSQKANDDRDTRKRLR